MKAALHKYLNQSIHVVEKETTSDGTLRRDNASVAGAAGVGDDADATDHVHV